MRHVVWDDCYHTTRSGKVLIRQSKMTVEDALLFQHEHASRHGHTYTDDEEALNDFIAVNWAVVVED